MDPDKSFVLLDSFSSLEQSVEYLDSLDFSESDIQVRNAAQSTVLPGKRVDFDHCVVSADFTCESCMYSVSILYTVRSMVGLSTCQIMECNELSSGI